MPKDLTNSNKITNSEVKGAIKKEVHGGDRIITEYVSADELQADAERYIGLNGARLSARTQVPYRIENNQYVTVTKRIFNPNEYNVLKMQYKQGEKKVDIYVFDHDYIRGLTSGHIKETIIPARVQKGELLVPFNVNMSFVLPQSYEMVTGEEAFDLFKMARLVS